MSWEYFFYSSHTSILVFTSWFKGSVQGLEACVHGISLDITLTSFRGNAYLFTPVPPLFLEMTIKELEIFLFQFPHVYPGLYIMVQGFCAGFGSLCPRIFPQHHTDELSG